MAGLKVLLSGGGTMGPVVPLLATVSELRAAGCELVFVGTPDGPERQPIEAVGIPFFPIQAPRLRRFWTWQHILLPYELTVGLWQSAKLLKQLEPQVIVSAGGFVSVPLVWMGWLKRIPSVIHQQDVRPGLANRLMQRFAKQITVSFEFSKVHFKGRTPVEWIGNPVRDLTPTTHSLKLDPQFPTVLIFGGGTGAQALNYLVSKSMCEFANVIHIIGKGKTGPDITHARYHQFEFLGNEMPEALAAADVVVCRAGLGTISELAVLKKVALLVPLPNSHQEDNASWLEAHDACIAYAQEKLDPERLSRQVHRLLTDQKLRESLILHLSQITQPNATHQFAEIIIAIAKS